MVDTKTAPLEQGIPLVDIGENDIKVRVPIELPHEKTYWFYGSIKLRAKLKRKLFSGVQIFSLFLEGTTSLYDIFSSRIPVEFTGSTIACGEDMTGRFEASAISCSFVNEYEANIDINISGYQQGSITVKVPPGLILELSEVG